MIVSQFASHLWLMKRAAIAADTGVDAEVVVDHEQEGVAVVVGLHLVARIRFVVRDAVAHVFDDARAAADAAGRIHATAVDLRTLHHVQRIGFGGRGTCRLLGVTHVRVMHGGSL